MCRNSSHDVGYNWFSRVQRISIGFVLNIGFIGNTRIAFYGN
jgi:hypothetical protein